MATMSRAQLMKELVPGLNALFGLEYRRYGQEHKEIYDIENSDRSFEEETKLSGFGAAPVKDEGEGIKYDAGQEAWTARWVHETIALGFSITEEAVEDNLYASLSSRYTKALARAMAYTKQIKGANILNQAFAAGITCGDGVSLCNASHPLVSGGVNSNIQGTPTDINETAIEAACIQIAAWTDERGLLIAARPKKLIIPTAQQFTATKVLETEYKVGSDFNDINAVKSNGVIPGGYGINNFLTDPAAWFITTDIPNGLKMFNRVKLRTAMDGDFDTGNARYKARERYSFGVGDPLGIWGSAGS